MTRSTFTRLPESKRKVFINVCLDEFAAHCYEGASISGIVKKLGIAKGSIYQYFTDKADLYEHLLTLSLDRKYEIINYVNTRATPVFKSWFIRICLAEIKFAQEFTPMYRVLERARGPYAEKVDRTDKAFIQENLYRFRNELNILHSEDTALLLTIIKRGLVAEIFSMPAVEDPFERLSVCIDLFCKGMTSQSQ